MTSITSLGSVIEIGALTESSFPVLLNDYSNYNIVIVVDENTHDSCLDYLITNFPSLDQAEIILLPCGEENKVMEVCMQVWNAFSEYGFGRGDLVINLGGGIVTDMGGFIASLFKRGMNFVNIPTTLLGMVDASIGGKNGIDTGPYKNQLGVISNPKFIFIDTSFLDTLPEKEFYNGYAEMLKYGLIKDVALFDVLKGFKKESDFHRVDIIEKCIRIKVAITDEDPYEKGDRKLLNFGHTIGHAVEGCFLAISPVDHGHAVGLGMCAEAYISMRRGLLNKEDFQTIQALLGKIYPCLDFSDKDIENMITLMYNDKKNESGKIFSVLLEGIGSATYHNELSEQEIRDSFHHLSMLSTSLN